jgi:FkbM family methyltransferase
MIESFDYYFDSVVPITLGGQSVVDMSTPRYHELIGFDDFPVMFPSHTEPYVTTTQYLDFAELKEGDTVLDIGAYAAVTSITFSKLVGGKGLVFAFEADAQNQACAIRNIRLAERTWGLSNVSLIQKAVWSHSNGIEFSTEGAMGSSAVAITGRGRGLATKVPSISLGDFCQAYALEKIDFIKIDIEGGEIEVLESSRDVLLRYTPKIIVEPHHVSGALSTEKCCTILREIGYQITLIEQFGSSIPLIAASPS